MEYPLLIYKDGRFTTADPEPDWYANLPDDSNDWEAQYEKAGLKATPGLDLDQDGHRVDVYVRDDRVYYAEFWDDSDMVWCATFGLEEWPLFHAQYVLPVAHARKLDAIHQEFVEYLVRNEPNNPEAARRRERTRKLGAAWKRGGMPALREAAKLWPQ
jgi:hypothetical protein